jgi:hypothetical protein
MKNFFLKKQTIFSLLLIIMSLTYFSKVTQAQSKDELYILFQNESKKQAKTEGLAYSYDAKIFRKEMHYFIYYKLYFKDSPYFNVVSRDYLYTNLVPIFSLSAYDVKTPEQLEIELDGWTDDQRRVYFLNLDHLYIVELYPETSQARIVEVRLNIEEE